MGIKLWALWVMIVSATGDIDTHSMKMIFGDETSCKGVAHRYTENTKKWPKNVDFKAIYYCTRIGKEA